ncbi:phage tail-collar fiber domain-containing protein [Yersinia enterocolitica]|uniref:phage tail-collar fiber domain-containing protein n=1 Tax=Yersinia enterocolitica TaxID=630 RepID=UPI0021E9A932|nr:phage tail protein [Yersinia enterocolitica]UYJ93287.1 phage tail protein [Yersinia enterocolitica]
MATAITRAFEHWQAQQILNNLPARPDTVIFAHIPGLDSNREIDRDEGIPDAALIVHREAVAQYGVINDSAVAYSVVLDTRVGDFSFNWIGLVDSASNTLCMIVHNALQQKIATAGGVQGNNITRTFVMEFDGVAEASQITVTAQTWQIDFSARLSGIDEITRLANYDYYGHAAFFADGFSVTKEADKYRVNPGLAYIGGIRALLTDAVLLDASENNVIYADVSLQGSVLGQFNAIIHIGVKNDADDLANYPDPNSFMHYVAPLALITASGEEDKRDANPFDKAIADINAALKEHEKSRNHPDATLNAKGFTQLGNDIDSDSETLAATLKAVKKAVNAGVTVMSDHVRDDNPHDQYWLKSDPDIHLPGQLSVIGDIKSKGDLFLGDAQFFRDGNIFGSMWGGNIFDYIYRMRNSASLTPNGWWKCNTTGMFIQWGFHDGSHGTGPRNFSIPFPSACLFVLSTVQWNSTNAAIYNAFLISNKNKDYYSVPTSYGTMYIAIGF